MPQYSALRCVSGIRQNKAKPLISNGLRFIVTCLPTAALWVLFHIARHTFATIALANRVSIESIAKMLGHTDIRTTKIYAKIMDRTISSEMQAMRQKFAI